MDDFILEPERKIPVIADYDVIVAGGGVAGILAAAAAGRNRARTLIVDRYDHLGGYFSDGPGGAVVGVSFQDMNGKPLIRGISWEFMERIFAMGGGVPAQDIEIPKDQRTGGDQAKDHQPHLRHIGKSKPKINYDAVQTLAIEMLEEAGVQILLHSWIVGVIPSAGDSEGVSGVILESKSGRRAIRAKVIVDCTGDADVVALAGASFDMSSTEQLYQVTRSYRVGNVTDEAGRKNLPRQELPRIGASVDGIDGTDAWDLTKAELAIWKQAWEKVQQLRKKPGCEDAHIVGWGEAAMLGVRETRRLVGEYVLTEDDIVEGKKFPDAVAKSACPIDMHLPGGGAEDRIVKTDYHDIPYRCLVPEKVENLLVAGRCISCTHIAEAAIRKVPVCMATGEAAGTAAALAVKEGIPPHQFDVESLKDSLRAQGALL